MLSIFYMQEKLKVTRVGNGCGGVLYIYKIHTHTHTHTYICVLSHVRLFPRTVGSTRLFCSWNCPGKNTRVGCHLLLQGIFPTQGSNSCLLHWWADSLPLNHREAPWVALNNGKIGMSFFSSQCTHNHTIKRKCWVNKTIHIS